MSRTTLSEIPVQEIFPGFKGRMIHSENMTIAHWNIDEGCELPEHSHPHEQIVNMQEGELEMTIGGKNMVLKAGDIFVIPRNVIHSGKALTAVKVMDVFSPVREDYQIK